MILYRTLRDDEKFGMRRTCRTQDFSKVISRQIPPAYFYGECTKSFIQKPPSFEGLDAEQYVPKLDLSGRIAPVAVHELRVESLIILVKKLIKTFIGKR